MIYNDDIKINIFIAVMRNLFLSAFSKDETN